MIFLITLFLIFLPFAGLAEEKIVIEVREPSLRKIGVLVKAPDEVKKRVERMLRYYGEVETGKPEFIIEVKPEGEKWSLHISGPGMDVRRNFYGKNAGVMAKECANTFVREVLARKPPFASNIAFVEGSPGKREVYVSSPDGLDRHRLSTGCRMAMSPSWMPDGRKLVFVCYMLKRPDIFILDLTEGVQKPLFLSPDFEATPAVSPDGRFLAYSSSDGGNIDLFLLDLRDGTRRRLTSDEWIEVSPSFSPDGKRIAYTSDRGGKPGIYIIEIETGKRERITSPFEYATSPRFSPDGKKILYTKVQTYPSLYLYYLSEMREEKVKIDGFYGCENPAFSPSEDLIAVSCRDEDFRWKIYILDLLSGKTTPLSPSASDQKTPSWSPSLW